jgi:branched-chain amino acid transport system substrate-binding protein
MAGVLLVPTGALAKDVTIRLPIIAPITGVLALEGVNEVNGAMLAVENAPANVKVNAEVVDSGSDAEGGANALERIAGDKSVIFAVAPLFGTQVLGMLPIARENAIPIMTPAGTAQITELGNPYVSMVSPNDQIAKLIQVRYALDKHKAKKFAILYNNTGYGQSGLKNMSKYIKAGGAEVVFDAGVELTAKDMSPVLARAQAEKPDVILLQMHAATTALTIRQAAASGNTIPIVANALVTLPNVAALLEPSALRGVCAESASYPAKGQTPGMDRFVTTYEAKFGRSPDLYAMHTYDGVSMALRGISEGANSTEAMRNYLATASYEGVANKLKSDGRGNLIHSMLIVCYDGVSREGKIVERYDNVTP